MMPLERITVSQSGLVPDKLNKLIKLNRDELEVLPEIILRTLKGNNQCTELEGRHRIYLFYLHGFQEIPSYVLTDERDQINANIAPNYTGQQILEANALINHNWRWAERSARRKNQTVLEHYGDAPETSIELIKKELKERGYP